MKVWFVVPQYEDGAWVSADGESDRGYASEKSAVRVKEVFDAADYEAHQRREAKRLERWTLNRVARSILEANGFQEVDKILPAREIELEQRRFESRYKIMTLEVVE